MEVRDIFGRLIHLTDERISHIQSQHPEIKSAQKHVKEVLQSPQFIIRSVYDSEVVLYYRFYLNLMHGKYLVVVVKRNLRNFVLTTYITNRIKGGKILWQID